MVDVGEKPVTTREAVARGEITMSAAAVKAIRQGAIAKGDPLQTARLAGIMASIAAPLLWMKAVQSIGPGRSSMFFNLVPIFTAVIAFMALGEPLAAYHAVGGVLTIGGLLLAELWKQPLRAPRAAATA